LTQHKHAENHMINAITITHNKYLKKNTNRQTNKNKNT